MEIDDAKQRITLNESEVRVAIRSVQVMDVIRGKQGSEELFPEFDSNGDVELSYEDARYVIDCISRTLVLDRSLLGAFNKSSERPQRQYGHRQNAIAGNMRAILSERISIAENIESAYSEGVLGQFVTDLTETSRNEQDSISASSAA